jgi:hypothetical protein
MNRKLKKIEEFVNANESIIDLKIKTNALADMLSTEEEFYKLSCRMRESGRFIKTQNRNGRIHIINSDSSNIRDEYYANHIESKRTYARFFNNLPALMEQYPNHCWYFVTLTIHDCHVNEVGQTLSMLNKAFQRLLQGDKFSRYFKQKSKEECGYYKILEVSQADFSHLCRPHIHAIFHLPKKSSYSRNYISQNTLINLWNTALNINNDEYKYVKDVTIERINYKDNHEQIINICNVSSYMIRNKLDLLRDKDFTLEYLRQIHAKNLCSSGGTLKGINKNNSNYVKEEMDSDNINVLKFNDYSSKYKLVTPSS